MSDRYEEFIAEGEELLESLHRNLVTMQDYFSVSVPVKPDVVNNIFRDMHTLKGISAVLGFDRITLLSHSLENLLDQIRMGSLPLSPPFLNVLFEGVDVLRRLLEKVRDAAEGVPAAEVDDGEIPDVLRMIEKHSADKKEAGPMETSIIPWMDDSIQKLLTEYETHRLQENMRAGIDIYRVKARFGFQNFDQELLNLQERITQVGEVIAILPTPGSASDREIEFHLLVGGQETAVKTLKNVEIEKVETPSSEPAPSPIPKERKITGDKAGDSRTGEPGCSPKKPCDAQIGSPDPPSVRGLSQTIRVDIAKLDNLLNVVGEIVSTHGQLVEIARELKGSSEYRGLSLETQKAAQDLSRRLAVLREGLIDVRMVPLTHIFDRLVRVAGKLSRETDKEVQVQVLGGETRMDKAMMEELATPLMHLVRNAVDHGIESRDVRIQAGKPSVGTITLSAIQKGNNVVIGVEDDGGGLSLKKIHEGGVERGWITAGAGIEEKDLIKLIFQPGFSTRHKVDNISGRGVGLDVVAKNVSQLRGLIDVASSPGEGTKFLITLPLTLLIVKALIVNVEGRTYAVPINAVSESLMISSHEIRTVEGCEVISLRGQTLPLFRLKDVFKLTPRPGRAIAVPSEIPAEEAGDDWTDKVYIVVAGVAEKRAGIVVDEVLEQREIVIKSLGEGLGNVPGIAGVTELGTRKIILVLDVRELVHEATSGKGSYDVQCSYH